MEFDFVSYAMGKAAGGGGGGAPVINPLSISENGTYSAPSGVDGYSPVTVAVPQPILINKNISENGVYSAASDGANGYSQVTVNVPSSTLEWNEPLARNWDFTNPINTRGSSEYIGKVGTINGWKQTAQTKSQVVSGGIKVIAINSDSRANMYYHSSCSLFNKTVTLSMMANNKVAYSTCTVDISNPHQTEVLIDGIYFWLNSDSETQFAVGFYNYGDGDDTLIQAVKLEFGSVSTLCDQNGTTVSIRKHQNLDEEAFFLSALAVNN